MPEYDDDDGMEADRAWSPIVVRRPVHEEGQKLLDAAPAGEGDTFETARFMANDFKAAGEEDKAAFWYEVTQYLQWRAAASAGFETIILEDGEEWDELNRKKIRPKKIKPGGRRRRSGKRN